MRGYEAMYILDPDIQDEDIETHIEKYKKVVADAGGEVTDAGKWDKGRRQLAYSIRKKREGIYILMLFRSEAAVPKELERVFKINEEVLRYLVVRQDESEE
jgi:small subunit ribosomal protein S6